MAQGKSEDSGAQVASPEPTETALELNEVSKSYGATVALSELSLRVEKGEFVSLLGPSGCGKTTTLQIIAGFVQPNAGRLQLAGRRVDHLPAHKRNIGVVFQEHALFPHMTVRDNVAFGLKMRKVDKEEIRNKVVEALELVHLSGFADRYPSQLSGGQQQRVALARAIVIEPDVLLLDEPLSSLDRKLRESLRIEIDRIHRSTGMTTIFVTHDQEEAMALSDRIVVLNRGQVEQIGSPRELYRSPASVFVADFLGGSNVVAGTLSIDGEIGAAVVETADLGTHAIPSVSKHVSPNGGAVALIIRPTDAAVAPMGSAARDDRSLVGTVAMAEFLGTATVLIVTVGSTELRLMVPGSQQTDFKTGDRVAVNLDAAQMSVVPADDTSEGVGSLG